MSAITWTNKHTTISAEHFPDRKRPALCVTKGNTMTVYGYFNDDASAELFIKELGNLVGASEETKFYRDKEQI